VVLVAAVLAAMGTFTAVRILGQGGQGPAVPGSRPVAVQPVRHRDVRLPVMRSWHQPSTSWPAAQTGTATISPASDSAFIQAVPWGSGHVHEDALLSSAGAVPGASGGGTQQGMPAGPTAGSARAGATPVWVGPAATSDAAVPGRQKTPADDAQYPQYAENGQLASRPKDAPVPVLPGSASRVPASSAATPASRASSGAAAPAATSPVSSAQVQVLSHQVAQGLGVAGTVFTVSRSDGSALSGRVHVSVDYSGFEYAYGGNYASRLHVVELPACALTTPQVAACHVQTPLGSADDAATTRAGADVTLPGTSASASAAGAGRGTTQLAALVQPANAVVLAVTASAQGSGGDYAAEPGSEMKQWLSGGSSGAYKDTYPIIVPSVPGGFEPNASLQYDSQLADGITAADNPEASEVGDGWASTVPGYIEIDYQTCAANWSEPDILDLCDQVQEESLTQNGATTPIVLGSGGVYKEEADDTSNIKQLSGGGWEIINPDGAQYYYGLNKLPGWVSGDPQTNSIWTVPLWSGNAEQSTAAPWRYMLDYVVDPNGNAIAYFYNTQGNYYATDGGSTANGSYTAGGVLAKTEYGLRTSGNFYSQTPAAEVNYTYSASRQDAPADLTCASGSACSVNAPTFWTSDALTGIGTEALVNGSLQPVDSYQLTQSYPATGDMTTSPSLWLSSVQQTGEDGTTPVTLPPTKFGGTAEPNLDQTSSDKSKGYSLITRDRLTSVTSDTGGLTSIAYTSELAACSSGAFPTIWSNADRCYPDYWYTNPVADTDTLDWYNLYAVSQVTQTDTTAGNPPVVTAYTYGTPGWHYDNDDVSRSVAPTWDQWRGFRTVTTETGTSPDPVTETADTYFQGLSGDEGVYTVTNGQEATGTVTMKTSRGISVQDSDQYAGMLLENRVFDGAGGSEVSDTEYDVPWSSETGSQTIDSSLDQFRDAYLDDTTSTVAYADLASGGSQETVTTETVDSGDNVTSVDSKPWGAPETCTTTTHVTNTSSNLTEPEEVTVYAGSCSSKGALASQTQYAYDGGAIGTAPTEGLVTEVAKTISSSGATAVTKTAYDEYGRVTSVTNPDNRTTTTGYSPATGAEPTQITVTDPMSMATVTTYDPARELPVTVTTPAGDVTTTGYDALGRPIAKWTAGNPVSGNPQTKYSYTVSQTAPSANITQVQEPGGGYLTSQTLLDSLGRTAETQDETASGGADITQTSYNSDGWQSFTEGPYYTSSAPSGTIVSAAATAVSDETGFVWDGAGRETQESAYDDGTATSDATLTYGGNYVTEVPQAGGVAETIFIDGFNRETGLDQYHTGVTASPSDPAADYDQTSYTYTAAGEPATVTDPAGNKWSFGYDLLGDATSQDYPDSGMTTATYDVAGQLMSVTDARDKTTSYTYDYDGRKSAEYDTTGGATENSADEIASWTYDTLAKGLPTSSTSYSGGAAYTEQVTGYNSQGLAEGNQTVIPSAQGGLAGTYTTSYTYAPDGQQLSYTDSAAGGLPAETVTTGYDAGGNPDSLTGASIYVDSLSYTGLSQPLEYTLGASAEPVYITDSYNPETGKTTRQQVQTGTAATTVDDLNYTYDADGLITSEADTPAGATVDTDVQCFTYDYLSRLTEAWAQGSTGCATNPTPASEGGPAPYLEQYTYNTENDLTGITSTAAGGAVTATTLGYPSAGSAQPHAVTGSSTTTSAGTSTASYGYDADGDLTSITSSTQNQNLTWSDNGKLLGIAVTPAGGGAAEDTGFVYDASGNQLIRTDPGTVSLYLGDEELDLNASAGTVTGTRYYAIGGQLVAATTSNGSGTTTAWLAGNSQNTEMIAIDATTLSVTRRWYDPYGNLIGTPPSAFPAGEQGFIGGTADAATSLTSLGVREYQPATGSFISTDSLLNPFDPQDLDPYAYAEDDPATRSDPTGTSTLPGVNLRAAQASASYDVDNGGFAGVIEITATVNVATEGAKVINFDVTPGGTSLDVEVADASGDTLSTSIALSGEEEMESAVSVEAEDEVENGDVSMSNDCSYCTDGSVDLGDSGVKIDVTWRSMSISFSGSKDIEKGKIKVEIDYSVEVKYTWDDYNPPPGAKPEPPALANALTAGRIEVNKLESYHKNLSPVKFIEGLVGGIALQFQDAGYQIFQGAVEDGDDIGGAVIYLFPQAGKAIEQCAEDPPACGLG
jgi:RHS repeat-associated protein